MVFCPMRQKERWALCPNDGGGGWEDLGQESEHRSLNSDPVIYVTISLSLPGCPFPQLQKCVSWSNPSVASILFSGCEAIESDTQMNSLWERFTLKSDKRGASVDREGVGVLILPNATAVKTSVPESTVRKEMPKWLLRLFSLPTFCLLPS